MTAVSEPLRKIPVAKESLPPSEFVANCIALGVRKPNSQIAQLAISPAITEASTVNLTQNFIGGLCFQALTPILAKNPNLSTLVIQNNGLSNESIVFFCRAMVSHPALSTLDVSGNPITLPAGEALLQLAQRNPKVTSIVVTDTNLDGSILKKIQRSLNLKRRSDETTAAKRKAPAVNSPNASSSPYSRVVEEYAPKREAKANARREEVAETEGRILHHLPAVLREIGLQRPAIDPCTGWTIFNLTLLAPPDIFCSEQSLIRDVIVPELNAQLKSRKVMIVVLDNSPRVEAGRGVDVVVRGIQCDYEADVKKASCAVIELIGDRIGLIAQTGQETLQRSKGEDEKEPLAPLQYALHKSARQRNVPLLVCSRRSARRMGLPPSLAPLFSDDPQLVHPDPQAAAVKVAIAKAQQLPHRLQAFDIDVASRAWERHAEFQAKAPEDTDETLRVEHYAAIFTESDMQGRVHVSGLNEFQRKLTDRLARIAEAIAAERPTVLNVEEARRTALIQRATELTTTRKHLLGKMDLYTMTPPSRNILLLHGKTGAGLSLVSAAYLGRCLKKPNYVVASHFCGNVNLHDEPTDRRSLFLSIIQQLSADRQVPKHMATETNIARIEGYFNETLQNTAAGLEEGKLLILVFDGLDALEDAALPVSSLRTSEETGADVWDGPGAPPPQAETNQLDLSFIPVCLPRNVRIVASAATNSPVYTALEKRGRDSTDCLLVGDFASNDIDVYVNSELSRRTPGGALLDDELASIREKSGASTAPYLTMVLDHLQHLREVPSYMTRSKSLEAYPVSLEGVYETLFQALDHRLGSSVVRTAIGALMLSRWGLLEMELRELLSSAEWCSVKSVSGTAQHHRTSGLLPCAELNFLLRVLRPVLVTPTPAVQEGHNALLYPLSIRCRVFKQLAMARYLPTAEAVQGVHQVLTHHYRKLLSIGAGAGADHPLTRKALKELPHHAVAAKMWNLVNDFVFSLDFVARCYFMGLGYHTLREYIRSYTLYEKAAQDSKLNVSNLDRMKQYIYFVRAHNFNLTQFPYMVAQIAIGTGAQTQVHHDAVAYFKANPTVTHLAVVNHSTGKLHRDAVTSIAFSPNGQRIASCSDDRSVRVTNLFAESLLQICQSASKLKLLQYSLTSRYIVAVTEDRTNFVFDSTSGQLVSRGSGHAATIRSLAISTRGKFYATASDDRTMKVWESETGAMLTSVSHSQLTVSSSTQGGVSQVLPHPAAEDTFYSVCNTKFLGWKLTHLRDACDQILCIEGHHSLPLSGAMLAHDGAYVITCAKEPALTANSSTVRSEENIKIWSIGSGIHIASLNRGPNTNTHGPQFAALSPSEQYIAAALIDGSIQLYRPDWRSLGSSLSATATPIVDSIAPFMHVTGFHGHATPLAMSLKFHHDSKLLFATGNERQLKIWNISRPTADSKTEEENQEQLAVNPSTFAEYMCEHPITAMDVNHNPQGEGGSIAIGDISGKILALKLVIPAAAVAAQENEEP